MGKIDESQYAIHHRIAERDEGVYAALCQPKDDQILPLGCGIRTGPQGAKHP